MKKQLSTEQALTKAAAFCSMQERCRQEVFAKLKTWEVAREEADKILYFLTTENYLNEERYALAFARGKFRMKKWGKIKISNELKQKMISRTSIENALEDIDTKDYLQTIEELMDKKIKEIGSPNRFETGTKVLNYLLSKGYEAELIYPLLKKKNYDEID